MEEPYFAGSLKAIVYEICQVIDEVLHALKVDGWPIVYKCAARFCNWSHRQENCHERE